MTFVAAKLENNEIVVVTDTMISRRDRSPPYSHTDIFPGILKLFIVSHDTCFGYAGTAEYAFEALREIVSRNERSFSSTKKILMQHHKRSKGETDFLLCDTKYGLLKISDRKYVGKRMKQLFIGNPTGYKSLQDYWYYSNFSHGPRSQETNTIGGIAISASSHNRVFNYISVTQMGLRYENGAWVQIDQSKGAMRYEAIAPKGSVPFYAIYYKDGSFGYLYDHVRRSEPLLIETPTIEEFRAQVEKHSGCEFSEGFDGLSIDGVMLEEPG